MKKWIEWVTDVPFMVSVVSALLAVVALLVVLSCPCAEPPKETDRYAQFAAQEEYYRVMELYGDTEGAVEAARVVFEKEADHAED